MGNTVDSNITGLRYAEETTLGVDPAGPWYPLEPNGYNDFGGQIKTIARTPINPSRQKKKGVTVDLDASGGFATDLTQFGLRRLMQGFFFADMRERPSTAPLNGTAITVTGVVNASSRFTAASGLTIFGEAGSLVLASGFTNAANNGLFLVSAVAAGYVEVSATLVDETPPSTARLDLVGLQFDASELNAATGSPGSLVMTGSRIDLTDYFSEGEWIFVGGDTTGKRFATAANQGFMRVVSVEADTIYIDKSVTGTLASETATGKTVQIFFGSVLKNEKDPALIKRRSFQLERTLGEDNDGTMSDYIVGAVPNEMSLEMKQADKLTSTLSFVATDYQMRSGATGVKSGTRPDIEESPAFNSSSDFSRLRMTAYFPDDTAWLPVGAYLTEATITLSNNVSPAKALAILGAFDITAGSFGVSGSVTAYFYDTLAMQAIRNNYDASFDLALVKNNAGMVFDMPLVALGEGRPNIEMDKAITIPISVEAAEGAAGHTLLFNEFRYLPTLADDTSAY